MTSTMIKTEEMSLRNELSKLAAKFPNWNLSYEFNNSVTDYVEVIKNVIKEMKVKFPTYKFIIKKDSYNSLLILNIKSLNKDEEFAYYGGSSCGYVVDNRMYWTLYNEFKNHSDLTLFDIRVFDFIENSKTMQLEFKKY